MERPKCPLIDFGCRQNTCAWWDVQHHCCVIETMIASTKDIAAALKNQPKLSPNRRKTD
ncbi:MAG TPA: hypothetical protein PKA10_17535 [Selenomonadales bacterium]|nr:hypothetical protein [Selenomonadales bacterium]